MILTSRIPVGALVACGLVAATLTAPGPVLADSPDTAKAAPRVATGPARAVYVTGEGNDKVAAHAVGASGALTVLAGVKDLADNPEGVAVSPDGKTVYVVSVSNDSLTRYAVAANGDLGAASPPVPTGDAPYAVELTPDGKLLFTANYGGTISAFRVGANGSLTAVGAPTPAPGGIYPMVISPNGRFLFYADDNDSIGTMAISATGVLTAVGATLSTNVAGPYGLAVSPDGRYVFAANATNHTVSAYAVGAGGALAAVGTPAALPPGSGVNGIAMTPNGRFLYTANYSTNNITVLEVGAGGSLTTVGAPFAMPGKGPAGLVASPDGKELYVADYTSDEISLLLVAANGTLTEAPGSPFPASVTDPDYFPITVAPNQGPVAKIKKIKKAKAVVGNKIRFNGRGSTDSDGTIAVYIWRFGDGKVLKNGGARPKHKYKKAGKYTVRLTVIDNEGCSEADISTGKTLHCNGSAAATTKIKVKVTKP